MVHALIPLIILFVVVAVIGGVGYVIYSIVNDIANKTEKRMKKHNVTFGKDGMKIGVKEIKDEDYKAKTQNVLVNTWNLSTWPAYKSRIWSKETQQNGSSRPGSTYKSSRAKN